jgi:Holliday junction DNA helicase RuvA
MITRMTGHLVRVLDEEVRLAAGSFEYQVLVPEFVRRQLQNRQGDEITLHTTQYFEGNQAATRFVPRLIGFLSERDLAFFDLFCTVDKVGVRKALKALNRPVTDIADAVHREDVKWLTTLPGIGPTTAKEMLHTLKEKIGHFVDTPATKAVAADPAAGRVIEDAYQALMSLGCTPSEARSRLDTALERGKSYRTVEELLVAIYNRG